MEWNNILIHDKDIWQAKTIISILYSFIYPWAKMTSFRYSIFLSRKLHLVIPMHVIFVHMLGGHVFSFTKAPSKRVPTASLILRWTVVVDGAYQAHELLQSCSSTCVVMLGYVHISKLYCGGQNKSHHSISCTRAFNTQSYVIWPLFHVASIVFVRIVLSKQWKLSLV